MLHFLDMMFSADLVFEYTISTDVALPNIRQLAISAGWDTQSRVKVNFTGSKVNQIKIPADWQFPKGLEIVISPQTHVGGRRGDYTYYPPGFGGPGPGGPGLHVFQPCTIQNLGVIAGGGGAGGSGASYYTSNSPQRQYAAGGSGGTGQGYANDSTTVSSTASSGYAGSIAVEEAIGGTPGASAQGGHGGSGGDWGKAGGSGSWMSGGVLVNEAGSGFSPGPAVKGNSFVTWVSEGTLLGGKVPT